MVTGGRAKGHATSEVGYDHAPYPLFSLHRFNSAKKDNDFIYHEAIPALDTLQPVKGMKCRRPSDTILGNKIGCLVPASYSECLELH